MNFKDFNIPITQIKHVVDGQQRLTSFSILLNVLKQLIESDPTVADQQKNFILNINYIIYCLDEILRLVGLHYVHQS